MEMDFGYVTQVSQTYAVDMIHILSESLPKRPLRYLYVSGALTERDQTKRPDFIPPHFTPEYCLMRVGPTHP